MAPNLKTLRGKLYRGDFYEECFLSQARGRDFLDRVGGHSDGIRILCGLESMVLVEVRFLCGCEPTSPS
jgi:hypothetical protein